MQAARKFAASQAVDQRKSVGVLLSELKLCRDTKNLERGKRIHVEAVRSGNADCIHVATSLANMYAKCGSMACARQVFDSIKQPDVVAWNSLILGYAENGEGRIALDLFVRMRFRGCAPDSFTFVAAIKACTSLAQDQEGRAECLELGKQIHSQMSFRSNVYVSSTLVDMYAKCGSMADARQVFDSMKHPNVVSWNSLILGYAKNGDCVTALDLFTRMKSRGCAPNCRTFVAALKACSLLGALESGIRIHAEMDAATIEPDVILITCLVDFYSKCGSLVDAHRIFDSHPRTRELRTWTALLTGYTRLGDIKAVFRLFEGMQDAGFHPDGVTFICLLACCSHAGLLEKANEFFEAMSSTYNVASTVDHYNCMVDILGRSNKLEDAFAMLRKMPWLPNFVTWMTVLGACRKWRNAAVGRLAFKSLVSLDDGNATAYVLMGHIYGSRGMLKEQEIVLGMRDKFRAWKEPGQSCWTNAAGETQVFVAGDNKHPQMDEIQVKLEAMAEAMRNAASA